MKQLIKTATIFALILSLLTLFDEFIGLVLNNNMYYILRSFPLYSLYFAIILLWSHKKHIGDKKNVFIRVLVLTLLLIFFSYCLDYIIGVIFYSLSDHSEIKGKLIGLLSIMSRGRPIFSPINDLIISPIELLKHYFLDLDIINFCVVLLSSKIIISSIIIYFESLFYLFRKFGKSSWHALIPIQNNLVLLSISKKPIWWIILLYVPFIKRIVLFFINKSIANRFNKSSLFSLGMTFLPPFFYGEISLNAIHEKKRII